MLKWQYGYTHRDRCCDIALARRIQMNCSCGYYSANAFSDKATNDIFSNAKYACTACAVKIESDAGTTKVLLVEKILSQ